MIATLTGWSLGLLLGVRHAFEPDHLAAVSTLVAERRTSRAGLVLGAAWGAGHTLTLLVFGGAVFLLRARIPSRFEDVFEVLVSVMLVLLGARALLRAARGPRAPKGELHDHTQGHDHAHGPVSPWRQARRPLLIGLLHGLAGTGALTAALLAEMPTASAGLLYIALFGLGSAMGMALLTGLLGVPLARLAQSPRWLGLLLGLTGLVSLGVGLGWGWTSLGRLLSG